MSTSCGRRRQHAQVAGLAGLYRCAGSVGWPDVPKNIVKASRAETHSSGAEHGAAAVVLWTAARIAAHGSPSPKGMSVDSATFTPALQQRGHPPQLVVFGGGDVGQVLVAALGDEVGLGHHGDPEVGEVGNAVVGDHGRVFDAVLRVGARLAQRRRG